MHAGCAATQLLSGIENFIFDPKVGPGSANCFYAVSSSCPAGEASHEFTVVVGDVGLGQIVTGNQYCGIVDRTGTTGVPS